MKNIWLNILKWIGIVVGVIVGLFLLFVIVLLITEFKPKPTENLEIVGTAQNQVVSNKTFKIMTWNIGYGALGDNADFFMDGGTMVNTATKERVRQNMDSIYENIQKENADFIFLQEVDKKSTRTHFIDQVKDFGSRFAGYQNIYARNFKVLYLPYPLPESMGVLDSGIESFSKYNVASSTRVQLPIPFKWPVSVVNIKRCVMINRLPIENSSKELVLINLHLEAFDDGEGKIAQTKMLSQLISDEIKKGNYVIAGGDFNQIFDEADLKKFPQLDPNYWQPGKLDKAGFDSSIQFVHDGSSPTGRSLDKAYTADVKDNFQFYVIDGFLVSPNISVKSVQTKNYDFKWTDHNPVVMTFELK